MFVGKRETRDTYLRGAMGAGASAIATLVGMVLTAFTDVSTPRKVGVAALATVWLVLSCAVLVQSLRRARTTR